MTLWTIFINLLLATLILGISLFWLVLIVAVIAGIKETLAKRRAK